MSEKITDPILILEWIRNNWTKLKSNNELEIAITKYLKASGDGDTLSVEDVIQIEESANIRNSYLK